MLTRRNELRAKLLLLRLRLEDFHSVFERSTTPTADEKKSELGKVVAELDPARRQIVFELYDEELPIGEWRATAFDLGMALDPEAILHVAERTTSVKGIAGAIASWAAAAINSRLPSFVSQITAENLRREHTSRVAIPLSILQGIRSAITKRPTQKRVLWLEIADSAGYLPFLRWESLLRTSVGMPIVRLPAKQLDPLSPRNSLDVLLACSTSSTDLVVPPKRIVLLIQQILQALPNHQRCVVHLFADETYRLPLLEAIRDAKIPVDEKLDPTKRRGVFVYEPFDLLTSAAGESNTGAGNSPVETEHPWALWVSTGLQGRAVDAMHIVADGYLSGSLAALTMSAMPSKVKQKLPTVMSPENPDSPEKPKSAFSFFHKSAQAASGEVVRLRYVDAIQLSEFAQQLGAWVTILSPAKTSAGNAHRVVAHQMSQASPGLFAIHELTEDADGKGIASVYTMLAANHVTVDPGTLNAGTARVPDNPAIAFYCNPARILNIDAPVLEEEIGPAAEALVSGRLIRHAMEVPEATPAWLAVGQRCLEAAASTYLEAGATTDKDKASRDGVRDALAFAFRVLGENSAKMSASRASWDQSGQIES